ncbi:MAG: C40 family peptidase [Nitrosomonas sp.]|nr:C40 family peptidase [Nitrosomonas sp.]
MLDNRRQLIIQYARECVGTPFLHQGRECGVGLDCVGVVCHVANKIGLEYTDISGYPRIPRPAVLLGALGQHLEAIPQNESMPGDVVAIKMARSHMIIHCGILTDYGIIHAVHHVGKVVETVTDNNPGYKIVGWYKF